MLAHESLTRLQTRQCHSPTQYLHPAALTHRQRGTGVPGLRTDKSPGIYMRAETAYMEKISGLKTSAALVLKSDQRAALSLRVAYLLCL